MNHLQKLFQRVDLLFLLIFMLSGISFQVQSAIPEKYQPSGLTVDFLAHTGQVFRNGYPVNTPLYQAVGRKENFQFAEISRKQPFFGWVVNSDQNNTFQTIPANTTANVYLPFWSKSQRVTQNGNTVKYRQEGNFAVVEGVGSGSSVFEVAK